MHSNYLAVQAALLQAPARRWPLPLDRQVLDPVPADKQVPVLALALAQALVPVLAPVPALVLADVELVRSSLVEAWQLVLPVLVPAARNPLSWSAPLC